MFERKKLLLPEEIRDALLANTLLLGDLQKRLARLEDYQTTNRRGLSHVLDGCQTMAESLVSICSMVECLHSKAHSEKSDNE